MSPTFADDPTPSNSARGMTPQALNIIRFALIGSVLLFGVVVWFLTGSGQMGIAADDALAAVMRFLFYGLFVIAFGTMYLVRQRVDRAETFAKKGSLILIGYAVAEGLAVFGGVYWILTGTFMLYLLGLLVFLVAFLTFPLPSDTDDA